MRLMFRSKWGICAALAVALFVVAAPLASAAEVSVDEYRELAEPVCKANVEANRSIFKGVKQLVREEKLKPASRHFKRAATAFGKTIGQLARIPRATGYETKLAKWLGLLRKTKGTIAKIGTALAAENKRKAESFSVELHRVSNQANNTVLDFGFNYCRIEQSRFG